MKTTNLFVELLVIGIGTVMWMSLAIISVFGYDWINNISEILLIIFVLPTISIVYLLGIITDRLADKFPEKIYELICNKKDNNMIDISDYEKVSYRTALKYISSYSTPDFLQLLYYGKSRLRICRSWVLNSIISIIILALNFSFESSYIHEYSNSLMAFSVFFLFVGFGSYFSWIQLNNGYKKKIMEEMKFIHEQQNKDKEIVDYHIIYSTR